MQSGRSPLANGSSVPRWPTLARPRRGFSARMTPADVVPSGLSTRRSPVITPPPVPRGSSIPPPAPGGSAIPPPAPGGFSPLLLVRLVRRLAQQVVEPLRRVGSRVVLEAQLRGDAKAE